MGIAKSATCQALKEITMTLRNALAFLALTLRVITMAAKVSSKLAGIAFRSGLGIRPLMAQALTTKTCWDYGFVKCRDHEVRNLAVASAIGASLAAGTSSRGADGIDATKKLNGMDTSAI